MLVLIKSIDRLYFFFVLYLEFKISDIMFKYIHYQMQTLKMFKKKKRCGVVNAVQNFNSKCLTIGGNCEKYCHQHIREKYMFIPEKRTASHKVLIRKLI
jgi:hypothetical protein